MKIKRMMTKTNISLVLTYYFAMTVYGATLTLWLLPFGVERIPNFAVALFLYITVAAFVFFLFAKCLPNVLPGIKPDVMMNVRAAIPSEGEHEIKIFQNALDFSSVKLRDCMIPRTDIVAVEEKATIAELKQKFIDTGVSKIIVYNDDIDNVIGYVHSKQLFKNPFSVQSMINELTFVPETMSGSRMMQLFMQERRSIAIVVDEYGGTSGLLTLEDIIEEIFGDIEDEHDRDNLVEQQISENEYLFSGRLEIEYLNETFHLNIPEKDDYDTLAGFILYHHLNLPLAGDMIHIEPYTFIIRKLTNTRIDLVQMTVNR